MSKRKKIRREVSGGRMMSKPMKAPIEDNTLHMTTKSGKEVIIIARNFFDLFEDNLGYKRLPRDNIELKQDHPPIPVDVMFPPPRDGSRGLVMIFYKPDFDGTDSKMVNFMVSLRKFSHVIEDLAELFPEYFELAAMLEMTMTRIRVFREAVHIHFGIDTVKNLHYLENNLDSWFGL
jgi:hypothetical protein